MLHHICKNLQKVTTGTMLNGLGSWNYQHQPWAKPKKKKELCLRLQDAEDILVSFRDKKFSPKSDPTALFVGVLAHGTAGNIIDNT